MIELALWTLHNFILQDGVKQMNSRDDQENELRRREREIQAREHAIRLREIEAEINQPQRIVYQSTVQSTEGTLRRWSRQLVAIVKVTAIAVAVIVGIAAGVGLFWIMAIAGIVWVAYKIFSITSRRH